MNALLTFEDVLQCIAQHSCPKPEVTLQETGYNELRLKITIKLPLWYGLFYRKAYTKHITGILTKRLPVVCLYKIEVVI